MRVKLLSLYVIGAVFFISSVIFPQTAVYLQKSSAALYSFKSHPQDFYGYVAMIRDGIEHGGILFHDQYTDPWKPDILFMPIYKVLGILAGIFHVDQFVMYFFARDIFSLLFICTVIYLCLQTFPKYYQRVFAITLSLTATSLWFFTPCGALGCITNPTTYVLPHLNSFYRLLLLAPHHYLALISMMINVILIAKYKKNVLWLTAYLVNSIAMVYLHPYVAVAWVLIFSFFVVFSFMNDKHSLKEYIPLFLLTCGVILPCVYSSNQSYKLLTGLESKIVFQIAPLPLPIINYLEGFGFIGIPFLISLLFVNVWKKNIYLRMYAAWTLIPFIGYVTPVLNQMLSFYRLFQIVPQIPAAIFSVVVLTQIASRYKKPGVIISGIIVTFFFVYHFIFVANIMPPILAIDTSDFDEFTMIKNLSIPFTYLKPVATSHDVIIVPQQVAPVIPALLPSHVLNGHEGNTDHFPERVQAVQNMYAGTYTSDELLQVIKKYGITYIIYGFYSPLFEQSPYKDLPYLEVVYKKAEVSVVKVNAKK